MRFLTFAPLGLLASALCGQTFSLPSWGVAVEGQVTTSEAGVLSAPSAGGAGHSWADTRLSESVGSVEGMSLLSPTAPESLIRIGTKASTGPDEATATATATAVESFMYFNFVPATISLEVSFDGSVSSLGDGSGNFASVYVFGATSDDGLTPFSFSTELDFYLSAGFTPLASTELSPAAGGGLVMETLTFTIEPVQEVHLWVQGRSIVVGPNGTSDASNTLIVSMPSWAEGLLAESDVIISVPEPAALAGAIALIGMLLAPRRRR